TLVNLPERHLAQIAPIGNFDLNSDDRVDIADVCLVEAAVSTGVEACQPIGFGDPVAGPCAPYPGGECSTTFDLNRDVRVDATDLALIERRVGVRCNGSPVP
ncbi:MAG: dockerin type I domain-containing protein, partial [Myxococcota bacterium]